MADVQALITRAKETLKERKPDQARAMFLEAAKLQGINLDQLLRAARQQMHLGDVEQATPLYRQIIDVNPTEVEALLGLARCSIYLGMFEEGESYLEGVLRLAPDHPERFVYQGLIHEARGDLQAAAGQLEEAVKKGPALFLAHYNFGRVMAQAGALDIAFNALVHATTLDPDSYDAFYNLGIVCVEAGQYDDAIASFTRAMELAPERVDVYATLADVLVEVDDKPTAMKVLNLGLDSCHEHPILLQKAAAVCSLAGRFREAVGFMEQVVAALPDYKQAWINLALYYILIADPEKSEVAAKRVIEIDPKEWQGYYHLGNLYGSVQLFEQAEAEYRKAIVCAPAGEERAKGNLGATLLEWGNPAKITEAMELLKQAIALSPPGDFTFHYNLALGHAKRGEKGQVRSLIKQIREKAHPDDEILGAVMALEDNVFSLQDEIKLSHIRAPIMPPKKKKDE